MVQARALGVYAFIEEWWGEPLTPALASRIAEAPWDQLLAFRDQWPDLTSFYRSGHLDQLRPGQIRPTFGRIGADTELVAASQLLLYVDEQVLDARFLDPLASIQFHGESSDTRLAVKQLFVWMAETRPLVESGSLLFSGKTRGRHPSLSAKANWGVRNSRVADWTDSELGELDPELLGEELFRLSTDLAGNVIAVLERGANPLALTRAEETYYRLTLGDLPIGDNRVTQLTTLARFDVPNLRARIGSVVQLRQDEEAFAEWRSALVRAMLVVDGVPEGYDAIRAAQSNLAEALGDALNGVERRTRRSPAIRALVMGSKGLAFAGIGVGMGAGVSIALGNPFLGTAAGLASAVGSKSAEAVAAYVANRKEQRRSRAIWDITMSFRDTS